MRTSRTCTNMWMINSNENCCELFLEHSVKFKRTVRDLLYPDNGWKGFASFWGLFENYVIWHTFLLILHFFFLSHNQFFTIQLTPLHKYLNLHSIFKAPLAVGPFVYKSTRCLFDNNVKSNVMNIIQWLFAEKRNISYVRWLMMMDTCHKWTVNTNMQKHSRYLLALCNSKAKHQKLIFLADLFRISFAFWYFCVNLNFLENPGKNIPKFCFHLLATIKFILYIFDCTWGPWKLEP